MTYINNTEFECPNCGQKISVKLYGSVNVNQLPELKEELLAGKLNKAECPKCKIKYDLAESVLYHDMEKKIMIQVLLSEEYSLNKKEAIKEFSKVLGKSFCNIAEPLRSEFRREYFFDVVFGISGLKKSLHEIDKGSNEKNREIKKDIFSYKPEDYSDKIKKFLGEYLPKSWRSNKLIGKLPKPDMYVTVMNEKLSLKYFPKLTKLSEYELESLEELIVKVMKKNNIDSKSAMIILEKVFQGKMEAAKEKQKK